MKGNIFEITGIIKPAVKYWRYTVKLSKRKLKLYYNKSSFSIDMVIVASDTTLILFLLYFAVLKLLWGIRIKRIKMMSIEQLSLDNRLELVLMPCLEGPAEICDTVPDFFIFFSTSNGLLKSANILDKTQLSQA